MNKAEQVAQRLVVGLDFGTASTKIVVRDLARPGLQGRVLRVGDAASGYPRVGTPSTVGVSRGRLRFGSAAERLGPASEAFRSLKVCVACQYGAVPCRKCARSLGGGKFDVRVSPSKTCECSADELAALYLAWCRQQVLGQLRGIFGAVNSSRVLWNMSVPLAQSTEEPIASAFLGLLEAAGRLEGHPLEDEDFPSALALVREAMACGLAPETERMSTTIPETMAALAGFVRLPTTEEDLYAAVDVGAGTTDVSFFRVRTRGGQRAVSFYDSGATSIGGDDFDRAVARHIAPDGAPEGDSRDLLIALRKARSVEGEVLEYDGQTYPLASGSLLSAQRSVAKSVWGHAQGVFRGAYQKERVVSRWRNLSLVLLGGGGRIHAARKQLLTKPFSTYIHDFGYVEPQLHGALVPCRGLDAADLEKEVHFLLLANGLAELALNLPSYRRPNEVQELPPFEILPRFDADDMYSK